MSLKHRTADSHSNTPSVIVNDDNNNQTENITESLQIEPSVEPKTKPVGGTQ